MNQPNQEQNEKKHNYFYKTTNLIDGKFYYGIHSTDNLNDYYLGSGTILLNAIKKHGRKNFKKEIIADYPTRKEANEHERLVVDVDMIRNPMSYNLRTGGDNEFRCIVSKETAENISKAKKGKPRGEEFKKLMKEIMSGPRNPNRGRKHSNETKLKRSKSLKGRIITERAKELLSIAAKAPEKIQESIKHLKRASEMQFVECIIEGMFFGNIKLATEYFNMTRDMIVTRLRSERDEWKNWNYFKLEDYI